MPVNVLVVGGGSIGVRHLRCFQQIGCEVALCDFNEVRRGELAGRYGLEPPREHVEVADAGQQGMPPNIPEN